MSDTAVSFYGGLTTIGGVHVLVEGDGASLLFDFGVPVDLNGLFGSRVQPPLPELLRAYLYTKIAPPVLDLYSPDHLAGVDRNQLARIWGDCALPRPSTERAVFVSHIHQDHMTLLRFAAPGLPVFMHRDAEIVYRCVQESGEYYGTQADIRALGHREQARIGSFRLTLLEHDHDTPGASGFLLETPDGTIAFTGDWRRHGRHPDRVDRFIDACDAADCDVLITEGTTLNAAPWGRSSSPVTELEVAEHYRRLLARAEGLVYVNVLARNTERVADVVTATHEAGRQLAMDIPTARFWHTALSEGMEALERYDRACEASIRIVTEGDHRGDLPYPRVALSEIAGRPCDFAYYITLEYTYRIADIETARPASVGRSVYFHADGNPLSDSDPLLHRWFYRYGIDYENRSTGGHADPESIRDMVRRVKPKVVVPLHSRQPSLLATDGIARYLPVAGESIRLSALKAKGGERIGSTGAH
ncbi:MAG: MBL fold metallo-hydrolase [Spirochaetota bacterium]